MTTITLKGAPCHVEGTLPTIGAKAPPLTLTNGQLAEVTLADFAGKKKVLNIVPSLDTPTCATSTRKFNEYAANLNNTVVLVVSADLPFAAGRFCATEGLANVIHLSTFRHPEFLPAWGVKIADGPLAGLAARVVIVLDENDIVRHVQLVGEIANEPDYQAALQALA